MPPAVYISHRPPLKLKRVSPDEGRRSDWSGGELKRQVLARLLRFGRKRLQAYLGSGGDRLNK